MNSEQKIPNRDCPNPACACDPCNCDVPCKCGLRPVARTIHESWDEASGTYRVAESVTYRPDQSGELSINSASGHAAVHVGHGPHGGSPGSAGDSVGPTSDDPRAILTTLTSPTGEELRARESSSSHTGHESESIRTTTHRGHEVMIKTRYELFIDGEPLQAHVGVNADGSVHYHGLPNYTTGSAVDLAKQIIDSHPYDYPPDASASDSGDAV